MAGHARGCRNHQAICPMVTVSQGSEMLVFVSECWSAVKQHSSTEDYAWRKLSWSLNSSDKRRLLPLAMGCPGKRRGSPATSPPLMVEELCATANKPPQALPLFQNKPRKSVCMKHVSAGYGDADDLCAASMLGHIQWRAVVRRRTN